MNNIRNQEIEMRTKEEINKLKEQLKTISKNYDHLKYRDKQMEHELRKLEMEKRSLQEKVTSLLSNREKKNGEKGLGIKVLNSGNGIENETKLASNSIFSTNQIDRKNSRIENRPMTALEQQQTRDELKQTLEKCNLLQSQNANLQTNSSLLLQENNELRNSLQSLGEQFVSVFFIDLCNNAKLQINNENKIKKYIAVKQWNESTIY
ncbi:viral A-type inclusion protein [Reticulomyxa filosa]|uniref:Viral A-type inclusion protein n=1 Tax=Reticulomyxa filosa TaxID=46433 RepID=X6NMX7_RETFI|nr:viral A-type inclusion protein [Reticulomyxa filosa]|eukprot:ETO26747.1 viral A-type inclusion protein [Reticulomyxa filosa]